MRDDSRLKALHAADAVTVVDPDPDFLFEVARQLLKRSFSDPDVTKIQKLEWQQELINLAG